MATARLKIKFPRWELDDLLSCAEFVVEASSYEQQALWEKHALEAGGDSNTRVHWVDQTRGWLVEVGKLDGRPVCVNVRGSLLNGLAVLFYEATSEVVDWRMIENWFQERCWPKWDNGTRRAHCDADNFHHCLEVACR